MGLLTIGAFARAARLTPKALRLYDELGVLPPAAVDPESGYRLYDPAQLERAQLIARLRGIGMPLVDIGVVCGLEPAEAAVAISTFWQQVTADMAARGRAANPAQRRKNQRSRWCWSATRSATTLVSHSPHDFIRDEIGELIGLTRIDLPPKLGLRVQTCPEDRRNIEGCRKFAVAPLPGLNGPGVSTLGGHNLAIGTYAANKGTAAEFIKYMSSEEVAKSDTLAIGQAHVNRALYSDPEILKKFPHFPILLKSIETANPRPKVVKYGDATLAMQDAAYGALQGQVTPEAALSGLQTKLEALTQ